MRATIRGNHYATFKVFADDSFKDDNNGFIYGVELHQNNEVTNVEWFKTQEEQEREFDQLNKELMNKEW